MKARLTTRELEVLKLIIFEYTTGEIASRLFLSQETIKSHRKSLLNKLGVRNVAGLVRSAFEYQLFQFNDIFYRHQVARV